MLFSLFSVFLFVMTHLYTVDFLGNWRSAVLRRIFCAGKSVSSAALLGVMQGRDTKPGAKETSKTVLRKFPRKSIYKSLYHIVYSSRMTVHTEIVLVRKSIPVFWTGMLFVS